uniref:Protein kinase domain-containing protein n=1 Tax=Leersia perrieri TaxID=77586 RepID=A0A0D9WF37_9ORYZ
MEIAPTPLPLLCFPVLFLVLSSCSLANGGDAPSSFPPGQSPVTTSIPAAAAANGTAALSSTVPAPPPVVVIVVRHHHFHRELVIAAVLACVATVMIVLSTLYAWTLWRRSRRIHGGKAGRSSGLAPIPSILIEILVLELSVCTILALSNPIYVSAFSDAAKGIKLVPILSRFNSVKMSRKRLVGMFEYPSLEAATAKFSESNLLGVGGFGCVYRAVFDAGVTAAVKRLEGGGPDCEKEFENELDLLGRIRHPNIVSLLGFCIHEKNHYIVYELMEKGSLETQLHGPSHGSTLSWHIRMKIALDTARGLEYLHEHCSPPVIHRDLKSSNILLDSDFNAKIADFGLAVSSGSVNKGSVKLSGTLGYVAPEYLLDAAMSISGKLTEKSDVYAFGVVLLELLMGRKPVEKMSPSQCQSIVTWAMPQLTDRSKLPSIVDPVIKDTMDPKHLYQVAAVAVLCVQPEPSYRPLITDVLHSLVPLVPTELGGTLRAAEPPSPNLRNSPC